MNEIKKYLLNKKNYIIAIFMAILIVVGITAVSYAYFTATVTNNNPTATVIETGTMAIEFSDGPEVNLNNAYPGSYIEKTFSVKNIGNVDTLYDIYFSDLINTFVDKSDLVYTLTSNDGGANISETQMPDESTKVVSNEVLAVGETHNYVLRIDFKETNDVQDDNANKVFSTVVRINEVQDAEFIASGLSYSSQYTDKTNVQDALDELSEILKGE